LVLTTQKETSTSIRVLSGPVKVHVVDPSAYTPPYDHALCGALAQTGVEVELFTSRFAYGDVAPADGYRRREFFYRHARGAPASRRRRALKLAEHVPDMLRYRAAARAAELVHFQWLTLPALDELLLPPGRPLVLTVHDPPGPRTAGAHRRLYRRMDALIVHSQAGRARLIEEYGLEGDRVHAIPHGSFDHLARSGDGQLPPELRAAGGGRVRAVLCFGLLRPYKGLDVLLEAWGRGISGAELWIVGRPRFDVAALRAQAPPSVRWVTRFVDDGELAACFRAADVVVLPYSEIDQSGVLATALAFAAPLVLSDVGGFGEVAAAGAARLVAPGDAAMLRAALSDLLEDPPARERLSAGARALAHGEWSWQRSAERTRALYEALLRSTG
jgi:glycosyltransferase involved in cell wall biosynthesis